MSNPCPYLTPITNESMIDRIIERIVGMITSREFRPGDKIPTENELCTHLGVGRNSVREAIKVLVYLGVLEIRRAEGTFVCGKSSNKMLNPLLFGLILEGDSSKDILELRRIFDQGTLELAIARITPECLTVIEEKLEAFCALLGQEHPDIDDVHQADMAFHQIIEATAGNPLVAHVGLVIGQLTQLSRRKTLQRNLETQEKRRLTMERHRAIFEALRLKDTSRLNSVLTESYTEWINAMNS